MKNITLFDEQLNFDEATLSYPNVSLVKENNTLYVYGQEPSKNIVFTLDGVGEDIFILKEQITWKELNNNTSKYFEPQTEAWYYFNNPDINNSFVTDGEYLKYAWCSNDNFGSCFETSYSNVKDDLGNNVKMTDLIKSCNYTTE